MKSLFTLLTISSISFGSTLLNSSLSSTSSADIIFYTDSGGILNVQPAGTAVDPLLSSVLTASAGAASGNVELYAGSDALTDLSATSSFGTQAPVVLTTNHLEGQVQVRSLNGQDWFVDTNNTYNLAFGADNLANQYFNDLFTAAQGAATSLFAQVGLATADRGSLYDDFVAAGGFAQISDPNISYVTVDADGLPVVGLAGFIDASSRLADLTGLALSDINANFANGFQSSEVAIVNGEALYSFSAVDSGVELLDGVGSYTGTYEVTGSISVPEPSAALLGLLGGLTMLSRRRR